MKEMDMFKVQGINVANIHNQSGIAFFGIAVLAGSNYETPQIAGISHFGEHLFFKGTPTRNWKKINEEFAKLGISNNAYTSNTEVVYHATCPKENLERTIALMSDLFFNSVFPKDEMEKERTVIIEEKKMYDDDPRSAFFSAIGDHMFTWDMGHDTIGTFDTIQSITRDQVIKYLNGKTNLDNFVFVCAGDIDSEELAGYIAKNISKNHRYLKKGKGLNKIGESKLWRKEVLESAEKVKFVFERENITQSNAYMMIDSLPKTDPRWVVESILYRAVGGGMYSRLFSRIRAELGLCYAVGMYNQEMAYPNTSIGNLYGLVSPENVGKFMLESEKVLNDVMKHGLSKDIFECAKTDFLADVLRDTETSEGKARFLVRKLLVDKLGSIDGVVERARKVTRADCNELARSSFAKQRHWAVMNPKKAK